MLLRTGARRARSMVAVSPVIRRGWVASSRGSVTLGDERNARARRGVARCARHPDPRRAVRGVSARSAEKTRCAATWPLGASVNAGRVSRAPRGLGRRSPGSRTGARPGVAACAGRAGGGLRVFAPSAPCPTPPVRSAVQPVVLHRPSCAGQAHRRRAGAGPCSRAEGGVGYDSTDPGATAGRVSRAPRGPRRRSSGWRTGARRSRSGSPSVPL